MSMSATETNCTAKKPANIVEMNWDPITRIVGSLGIYTKIDFGNRVVSECHSTSSIFRGYSIFMKGKDPRDAHFITSRICGICGDNHATCSVYAQNMAYGVKPPPIAEWIVNLGEAAEYMFDHNIFPGQPGRRRFLREDGQGNQSRRVGARRKRQRRRTRPITASARSATSWWRSIPSRVSSTARPCMVSRYTREMFCLMEGRHVHPSTLYPGGVGTVPTVQLFTDYLTRLMRYIEFMKKCVPLHDDLFDFFYQALPGYEEVGRRRILLGCWGSYQDPEVCDYNYKTMTDWGRAMFVTPGVVVDGETGHDRSCRHQSEYPDPARPFLLRRVGEKRDIRQDRSTRQQGRSGTPVESDHHSAAAEARLRRQVFLGDVPALARQANWRSSGARHWRRGDRATVGHRVGGSGRHRLRQGDRQQRHHQPAEDRAQAGSGVRVEEFRSGATPSSAIGRGPISRPIPRLPRCTSWSRRWPSCRPAAPRPSTDFKVPE